MTEYLDSWVDLWRWANVVVALFAVWLLLVAYRRQRKSWTVKTHDHWWALVGWVALSAYSSAENVIQAGDFGVRVPLTSLVIAFTVRALLRGGELRAQQALAK